MSAAAGKMESVMFDTSSPLCTGCSAMVAWVAGAFFHDLYPVLAVWSLLASTILSTVGLVSLGRKVFNFCRTVRRDTKNGS